MRFQKIIDKYIFVPCQLYFRIFTYFPVNKYVYLRMFHVESKKLKMDVLCNSKFHTFLSLHRCLK